MVTQDVEKTEVLSAFLYSVFTSMICLQESQAPETREKVWRKEALPMVEEGPDCGIFKETRHAQAHGT